MQAYVSLLAIGSCVEPEPPTTQGLWPNYVKVVPSIAIAFVSYEQLKEMMGVQLRISS